MKYLAVLRRGSGEEKLTLIPGGRIRQIGTAEELGIEPSSFWRRDSVFIQTEEPGYDTVNYLAIRYRVMEIER